MIENEVNWLSLLLAISSEEWHPKNWMADRMLHPLLGIGQCVFSFNRFSPVCIVYGQGYLWNTVQREQSESLFTEVSVRLRVLEDRFVSGDRHFWDRFVDKLGFSKKMVVRMLQKEDRTDDDFIDFYYSVFNVVHGEGYYELKVFEKVHCS